MYKPQTDRAPIVGALRCVSEYEHVCRVHSGTAHNVYSHTHAHARTRLLMYITAACTPYALLHSCVPHGQGGTHYSPRWCASVSFVHESAERRDDFRTVIIAIKSQLQLRMTKFSPAVFTLSTPTRAVTPTHSRTHSSPSPFSLELEISSCKNS